ncbi:SRPBCC domain-containing protein [Natrinema sp. SYSU A 869]|uniref:SRPBCC domain-containing protein n=1 Tax=Natrinema sp. SYSU A 869 TaxID=2871694 RepID=UPI002107C5FB|nr:SRPBCC domain-containing protein [Natrinema sp. SYSU A 869]
MTENTTNETLIETNGQIMTAERHFDAPRERVFDAWTDPDQVDQWWGPTAFSIRPTRRTFDRTASGSSSGGSRRRGIPEPDRLRRNRTTI